MNLSDFNIGDRVELHPATDAWMFGDRFGAIIKLGRKYVHIKCDRSGLTRRMLPEDILRILA